MAINNEQNKKAFLRNRKPDRLAMPTAITGFISGFLLALLSGCSYAAPMDDTAPVYITIEPTVEPIVTESAAPIEETSAPTEALTVASKATPMPNAAPTAAPTSVPEVPAREEETLLTIAQAAAGHQMETYVYMDMDHDGSEELIGTYRDDNDLYQTWYCSSDGRTCKLIHQNDSWMDACNIELLEFDSETHVVIDAYCLFGTSKNYTVIALKDNIVSCLLSNKYGYVCMTENGDITLDVESYDAMYDADLGFMGHTWNDTYLYFDGETYREYGATEITESEYLRYENSQTLKDMIANTLEQPDTVKTEYSYFIRKNGLMHIQCNIYNNLGTIKYRYYTIRFSNGILDNQLGDYIEGQMSSHFSDLEVTY